MVSSLPHYPACWRESPCLASAADAFNYFFGLFVARPRYYAGIALRSAGTADPSAAEDVIHEAIARLARYADVRASSERPIRAHPALLAKAVANEACGVRARHRDVLSLDASSNGTALHVLTVADQREHVDRADLRVELTRARDELRRLIRTGQLVLTTNQYEALLREEDLDDRTRSARRYGLRRLRPWLRTLAERLRPWAPWAGDADVELGVTAVRLLLDAVGFFDADIAGLVKGERSSPKPSGGADVTLRDDRGAAA